MDYFNWIEKRISINSISLDFHNPRISPDEKLRDQRSLLAALIQHDKIYDLAKNISRNGYFPVESLILTKENNKNIVLEGNRRVAALKLLISPDSAPKDQISKFRSLSKRTDLSNLKKVKVIFAPDRESAALILINIHTTAQIESWKPIMKAAFYYKLLQDGISIDILSQEYNITQSAILSQIRNYKLYQIACSLDLPDNISEKVNNPREFNSSTLVRFFAYNVSREFLGIKFDEAGNIIGSIDEVEFKKGYTKVITDIASGRVDSRTLGNEDFVKEYIKKIPSEYMPDTSKKNQFIYYALPKSHQIESAPINVKLNKTIIKPKPKSKGLIPDHISCEVNNQRINDIVKELKTIPVATCPNATAVLFRSLLEMALSHYLITTGDLAQIIEEEKTKRLKTGGKKLENDWQPTLKQMLIHITSDKCAIIQNPNLIKALQVFIHQSNELFSHDSLNYFVHNQYYYPNEDILRGIWNQLEGLFQILLVEADINN